MVAKRRSSTVPRDWAWLPCNVLDSILTHLPTLRDYLRFTSVCKPWNSASEPHARRRTATSHRSQAPLLLVPTRTRSREWRGLYDAAQQNKLLSHALPVPYHRRCCGSSHGWLAFLERDYFVTLYNPFTRARISLPRIIPAPDYITTVIDRAKHDRYFPYDVKKEWKHAAGWVEAIDNNNPPFSHLLSDVIFRRDRDGGDWVYASGHCGLLARAECGGGGGEVRMELVVPPWGPDYCCTVYKYLVESSDGRDLLVVLRFYEEMEGYEFSMATRDVKVFRLRRKEEEEEGFVEVKDLNGDAVFVGDSYSTAVRAGDFEDCRADCVYYSDDFTSYFPSEDRLGPHDVGVFDVKEEKFGSHYVPTPARNRGMPPPIWVFPTLTSG
ncbi:unnamed protein product [Linum tenue]|uniref:KIB1-4 beta-propeller domain-containing protein n=1 Tax=Linum tenue TaxID=586396 RepID=A0AAV0GQE9_9ROSI|nr:unnamed protein product [Linum tenue]